MRNALIQSIGSHLPSRIIPNAHFDESLKEDVSTWLETKMNIFERRWCDENESTLTLCVGAAQKALATANLKAGDLDLLIVGTDTPENISPSTASAVQHEIGAVRAGVFDVNAACSSFITGIDVAAKFIRSDPAYSHILVISGYAMSKYLDKKDKMTVTLFADGAGAAVISATENSERGFLAAEHYAEGQYHDYMGIYSGGTRYPISSEALAKGDHCFRFTRRFPKEINPKTWTRMIRSLCGKISVEPNEVDHYFMTQLNINAIYETMDNLGVDRSRAYTIMDRYAYTGTAAVPMAMDDAVQKGKLKKGDLIFLVTSGGGLSFSAAAFRF